MTRVVVVAGKDPKIIDGGMESYLRAYGRAAIRAGYSPHHFCVSDRTEDEVTDFGVVHRARSPFRPYRSIMLAAHQPFLVDCVERFVGSAPGRVLVHSFGPWSGVGVAVAAQLRKRGHEVIALATPYGAYHHEIYGKVMALPPGSPLRLRLQVWIELFWTRLTIDPSERRGFTESARVLVNYASVEDIIARRFGRSIRFGRITYSSEAAFLHAGVPKGDEPEMIASVKPREAPLLVSVSRHDPRKGLDTLLHALAFLQTRGVPFRACLVGGGDLLEWHRDLAARLNIAVHTAIVGRVPNSYAYLEHADVFVLPSREEGSGSVSLLEAMQAGVAPVVSRIDGLPEDVVDGESALLVDAGDAMALANSLERLIADPGLRERLARGARARYLERFSADAFAEDLRSVYSALGFAPEAQSRLPPAQTGS
jgi:glycosyltransferase involved in cell wall biosynthesis